MLVMKILCLCSGQRTPLDGQYLKEYDPNRDGVDPMGRTMMAHIVTTPKPSEAMKFNDLVEVHATLMKVDERDPVRQDGMPNRPLTAFHVVTEQYHDVEAN